MMQRVQANILFDNLANMSGVAAALTKLGFDVVEQHMEWFSEGPPELWLDNQKVWLEAQINAEFEFNSDGGRKFRCWVQTVVEPLGGFVLSVCPPRTPEENIHIGEK